MPRFRRFDHVSLRFIFHIIVHEKDQYSTVHSDQTYELLRQSTVRLHIANKLRKI